MKTVLQLIGALIQEGLRHYFVEVFVGLLEQTGESYRINISDLAGDLWY